MKTIRKHTISFPCCREGAVDADEFRRALRESGAKVWTEYSRTRIDVVAETTLKGD